MYIKINEATNYIKTQYQGKIDLAIILGTGLSPLVDELRNVTELDYRDIPHFPLPSVEGLAGKLIIGTLANKTIIAMKNRFHYYEGTNMDVVTLPIRVFKRLGINNIILTNACGGINDDFDAGDIMIINDHISLFTPSPLRGSNLDEFGPRFIDMSNVYHKTLRDIAFNVAKDNNIILKEGVFAYVNGPMYETPAEIKALKILGSDVVGMSTVPEAIVAHHCDMNILGISLITNKAAGLSPQQISHEEIVAMAAKAKNNLITLIKGIVETW